MFDPEKAYDTRTLDLPPLAGPALRCAEALSHQAKNLRNIGSFLIRQVVTAYGKDETSDCVLKAELHAPQALAISHFNTVIDAVNADRTARHPGDVAKWLAAQAAGGKAKKKPVLKLVPRLEARMDGVFGSVLDVTVLDNALKTYRNEWLPSVPDAAIRQRTVQRLPVGISGGRKSRPPMGDGGRLVRSGSHRADAVTASRFRSGKTPLMSSASWVGEAGLTR